MKRLTTVIALAALIMAGRAAGQSSGSAAPLYVQVDTDNPAGLDRLEHTNNQQEFANDSLRESANYLATAAHWTSPIVVLHRGEQAPNGSALLRLILPEGTAEYIAATGAKPVFLGRVGALAVHSNHPDPYVYRHRVDTANLEDRPIVRQKIELEKDLYASLETLEKHLGKNSLDGGSATSHVGI